MNDSARETDLTLLNGNIKSIAHEQRVTRKIAKASAEKAEDAIVVSNKNAKTTRIWIIAGVLVNVILEVIQMKG